MYKISMIGDRDSILGFKALGYSVYEVRDAFEAERVFEKIAKDSAIVFIVENFAEEIKAATDKYRDRKLPAVVPVPGAGASTGLSMRVIRDAMERAVGADILFREE